MARQAALGDEQSDSMDQRIRAAIDFMNSNLHLKLTVNEIAKRVCLSPSHLNHLFKIETGLPVARYLNKLRLERGKELLETTFLNVKQIASEVGQSSNHFTTNFKRAFRVSPSHFAARYRNTKPRKRRS